MGESDSAFVSFLRLLFWFNTFSWIRKHWDHIEHVINMLTSMLDFGLEVDDKHWLHLPRFRISWFRIQRRSNGANALLRCKSIARWSTLSWSKALPLTFKTSSAKWQPQAKHSQSLLQQRCHRRFWSLCQQVAWKVWRWKGWPVWLTTFVSMEHVRT